MPTQVLWPILASLTAIGLHWIVNVPSKPRQERKPESAAVVPRPKKTKSTPTAAHSRSRTQLRLLQNHWSSQPFEDEPENKYFRSKHEAVLHNFMTEVQSHAKIAPKDSNFVATVNCKTVRCQFEICGTEEQLAAFLTPLKNVQVNGQSIWRSFIETNKTSATNTPDRARDKHQDNCKTFVISLTHDLERNDSLTIPSSPTVREKAKKKRVLSPKKEAESGRAVRHASEKHQSKLADR